MESDSDVNEDKEYPSDEELKNNYTFIHRKRIKKNKVRYTILKQEDYISD